MAASVQAAALRRSSREFEAEQATQGGGDGDEDGDGQSGATSGTEATGRWTKNEHDLFLKATPGTPWKAWS